MRHQLHFPAVADLAHLGFAVGVSFLGDDPLGVGSFCSRGSSSFGPSEKRELVILDMIPLDVRQQMPITLRNASNP